ncbi:DUF6204 family protein [Nocardiopsis trehalosi]|jgi:hypothetical protein|uniref:DUF6204 family protein n=1 Tax=Nocardiopsis trehalosi TaxID=109329 RepID=UPI00082AA89E|nr:DUF6204 family protein [Nocardiopsis trehalosi]
MNPPPVFRVTIRGRFTDLSEADRAALRARTADDDAFFGPAYTEAGTLSCDAGATVFTFRCQVPAAPDDDEDTAALAALAALDAHGLGYADDPRIDVTDLRKMRVHDRKRRRGRR